MKRPNPHVAAILAIMFLLLIPLVLTHWRISTKHAATATNEQAIHAIELVKDWGTWLTGIATAAIGAIGLLLKDRSSAAKPLAVAAVVFLGLSVILNSWLLALLPSLVLRLKAFPTPENDIFEMALFPDVSEVRVGIVEYITHWLFIGGITFFAYAFLYDLIHPDQKRASSTS